MEHESGAAGSRAGAADARDFYPETIAFGERPFPFDNPSPIPPSRALAMNALCIFRGSLFSRGTRRRSRGFFARETPRAARRSASEIEEGNPLPPLSGALNSPPLTEFCLMHS